MGRMVGRYELLRPLGRGGMAEVFLARRRGPGGVEKRLVVKRIRRERARDPRFLKLFVQEARLSMALAHKNIVPMFDFGRAGDELFLVMEYVDGVDLGAIFELARERDQAMDPVVAAFIVMEACQALEYAHRGENTVIHRDVTPRNVLVSRSGEVKLVDFGVATSETDLGGARKVRGTPAYMAPEQARGEDVDGRADVFSLGLVLYEALAGRRAYDARDNRALLGQARAAEVPPLPSTAPDELRDIIARATRADPDERFASAQEMQIALDAYVMTARSAGENRTPPALRLSTWLRELLPAPAGTNPPDAAGAVPAPEGPVVTFLEDGLEEVVATLAPGDSTMRSIADTVIDETGAAAGDHTPGPEPTAQVPRQPARRWPLVAGALVVLGGGALAVVAVTGGEDAPGPAAVVADADAGAVATTAPPDATPPPPDAAPPPPDAAPRRRNGTARVKKPPPAGPPGTVTITCRPWARVTVEGRGEFCVQTPCDLELPPGTYQLHLVNPPSGDAKDVTVTVESGKTRVVREQLTRRQ